jgi:hypothetical protein
VVARATQNIYLKNPLIRSEEIRKTRTYSVRREVSSCMDMTVRSSKPLHVPQMGKKSPRSLACIRNVKI